MKRDMDLVRKILLFVEGQDVNSGSFETISIEGYTSAEVYHHVKMMEEYGLIDGCSYDLLYNVSVETITWDGYDFLDKIRDTSIWSKTKDVIAKKGLPLIFDTIKTVSSAFVTAAAEGVANSIIKNGGILNAD